MGLSPPIPKEWISARCDSSSGFFLLDREKHSKKKPAGMNAAGLNPSFGRVEETE
jgi:hypothetical protein